LNSERPPTPFDDDKFEKFRQERMTAKERFEQEQLEKENKPVEEEDHQEDVSFEGRFMYTKLILFSTIFFGTCYYIHTRIQQLR